MPVEEFGRAMLRGMGWEDGMVVGRNRKKVEAIEYLRRPERLGLGAQPVLLGADPTKPVKMGEPAGWPGGERARRHAADAQASGHVVISHLFLYCARSVVC